MRQVIIFEAPGEQVAALLLPISLPLHRTWRIFLGMTAHTKTEEFWEKFRTAFEPPLSFLKNLIADFF